MSIYIYSNYPQKVIVVRQPSFTYYSFMPVTMELRKLIASRVAMEASGERVSWNRCISNNVTKNI